MTSVRAPRAWVRPNHRTKNLHPSRRRYEVIYEDPTRNYRQRTKGGFKSKQAAQDWADDFSAKARRNEYIDPQQATITFNALANEWHRNKVWERVRTKDDAYKIINGKRSPTNLRFGQVAIGHMTHEAIAEYVADLSTKRAPQTVRNHYYVIKPVLDYAVRTGRILANPALGIDMPQQRKVWEAEEDRYPLQTHETDAILSNLPEPVDVYARLIAKTGMRPEECAGLTLADPNLDDGTVHIRAVVVEASGRLIREEYTKTSHSRRTVTLDSATLNILREYVTAHQARALAWFTAQPDLAHPGDALPLFVGWEDGRGRKRATQPPLIDRLDFSTPIRPSAFTKQLWHKARTAANVPHCTPYSLRHAHASLLVDRIGQPGALTLKEIQNRLGHHSGVMTIDRYAHAGRPDHDKARRSLDAALAPDTDTANVVPIKRDA